MPLHEYHCRKCEHTFEVLTTARDSEKVECPECASTTTVDRLFGLPARPTVSTAGPTNCAGTGPPCGAPFCGRKG